MRCLVCLLLAVPLAWFPTLTGCSEGRVGSQDGGGDADGAGGEDAGDDGGPSDMEGDGDPGDAGGDACQTGATRSCGSSVGACEEGEQTCAGGRWGECEGDVPPVPESCNGEDDDCDGATDEGLNPCGGVCPLGGRVGEPCDGDDADLCPEGTWACSDPNLLTCSDATDDSTEACNGLDDDCDAVTDEGCDCVDGSTRSCGSDVGACREGVQTCTGGIWGDCEGGAGPSPELCNGLDDDCDEEEDENFPGLGVPCSVGVGACTAYGVYVCTADGASTTCDATPGIPSDESCNGLDDDCDGDVDEDCPCPEPWADCNAEPSDGCEANLDTDPGNCGRCAHGCQGGTCDQGRCQPVTLATDQTAPYDLAVDDDHVYWTCLGDGKVRRVVKTGGVTEVVADSGATAGAGIRLDSTYLFWSSLDGTIWRIAKSGGTAEPLATAQGMPWAIALDEDRIYYSNGMELRSLPKEGGGHSTLTGGTEVAFNIVVDSTHAYWTEHWGAGDRVLKVAKTGGALFEIAANQGRPWGVAVGPAAVYWTQTQPPPSVLMQPLVGGPVVTLVPDRQEPRGLAVDATHLYFADHGLDGIIGKVPLGGGDMETIVHDQQGPWKVAVDDCCVYWTSMNAGTVTKVAK